MSYDKNYQEKYLAFIDILGFKEIVKQSETPQIFEKIIQAFEHLSFIKGHIKEQIDELKKSNELILQVVARWQDAKIHTFSDSIFISIPKNEYGLMVLGEYTSLIYNALFANGFLARGAITKGKIFEDTDVVFGEGLIEAYELESRAAIYPRILISNSVAQDIQSPQTFYSHQDFDGNYILDVFHKNLDKKIEKWNDQSGLNLNLNNGRDLLIQDYDSVKDPNIKSKLYWLIKYFNSRCDCHKLPPIKLQQS